MQVTSKQFCIYLNLLLKKHKHCLASRSIQLAKQTLKLCERLRNRRMRQALQRCVTINMYLENTYRDISLNKDVSLKGKYSLYSGQVFNFNKKQLSK